MTFQTGSYQQGANAKVLRDELIELQTLASRQLYSELLRRIVARVMMVGQEVGMVFLSNNLEWSAARIVELSRRRWRIEVFFEPIKQTLQLTDSLGGRANVVRSQV
jgi:hypothetical protein